jgi:HK97 family phage portal protein
MARRRSLGGPVTLGDRLRYSWHQLTRNVSKATGRAGRTVLMWPYNLSEGDRPVWIRNELESYAAEGFQQNGLIYAAIMYKVRSQQLSPLRAYWVGDANSQDHPIKVGIGETELSARLHRPNPSQSWAELQGLQTVYLNLSGNSYTFLLRDAEGALPTGFYPLRPDWVYHVPGPHEGTLLGYVYAPPGTNPEDARVILPEDMIHVKLPHPLNPMGGAGPGLSPLSAAALVADVDNMVNHLLREFFKSGAMPLGLLKFPEELNDDAEVEEIRSIWRERYGGVMNWLDVAVIGGGGEYQRVGLTFDEMGFETLDERNETRILSVLGVPAVLLGVRAGLAHATYSNAAELRRMFWEDTFLPELLLFEIEYQHYLNQEDQFVAFDFTGVPALQEDVPAQIDGAYKLWTMGYPASIASAAVGLELPSTATSDISFIPASMQPAGLLMNPPAPTPERPGGEADDASKAMSPFRRTGGWPVPAVRFPREARRADVADGHPVDRARHLPSDERGRR